MKKIALLIVVLLAVGGCAIKPKASAVREAADQGLYQGLDAESKFAVSIPSPHSGPYSSVDQLNFKIEQGKHKGKNASAIVAKSRTSGKWEVLHVVVEDNGSWVALAKE